jgi:hypothetical protein
MDAYSKFAKEHGGPICNEYQLYWKEAGETVYFLQINGAERKPIKPKDLNIQGRFRDWHLRHHYKPPQTERDIHKFEQFIEGLLDTAIKLEDPSPALRTNAEHIDRLVTYFDINIPSMVRHKGQEFLDGKVGDIVRVREDTQRIYFKWKKLKTFLERAFRTRAEDLRDLLVFLEENGGYQGEHEGREWFRCTYWVPIEMFDEVTRSAWFSPFTPGKEGGL